MLDGKTLLLFVLAAVSALPLSQICSAQTPAPAAISLPVAAKLRRLLPFPEETLRQTMEMSIGIAKWPGGDCRFRRYGNGYDKYAAADSAAVRRTLTGGLTDAPRYLTLGGLYHQAGLPQKASAAYAESAALCRNALRRNPRNGYALAEYGRTLAATRPPSLAEKYLKHAATLAPKSADVQMVLGSVLVTEAKPGTETGKHFAQEAASVYDRAVSLAPQNPVVWTARAVFRTFTLPDLSGRPPSSAGLSDYEKAARLSPDDLMAQIAVPDMELFVVETAHHLYTSPAVLKAAPRSFNLRAKESLRRLTKIAQSTHGHKSAEAYDARAWVQFEYFYDPVGTQESLRLALLQDPADDGARDYQMHVAAVNGDYALLAAFCRRNLRRTPSVRQRTIFAYADYFLAQQKPKYWREGLAQMKAAHAAEPRDYALRLGLAVLLLKSGDAAGPARASALLGKITLSAPDRTKAQQSECNLIRGIGGALAGDNENARRLLALALQEDPHSQAAKSASALIPPPSPPVAAKLRGLLPFPEATLDPKAKLNFGLGFSLDQSYHFLQQNPHYMERIVAVRRQMTGGTADAAQYRQLGGLFRQVGLLTKSKAALQRSKALYAAMLVRRPRDGAALAGYAESLQAAGQDTAAEAYLRKAVQIAPRSADVWLALGAVLEDKASPTSEAKMHWGREIGKVYNQAVSVAPKNPSVWAMRGRFRCWGRPQLQGRMSSRDGLSDYEQAASLLPQNPDAQALAATTDCFTFEIAHHVFTSVKAAKMEPAASDRRAEAVVRRITAMAQSTTGAQSAEAYTARAWVQFEFFCDFNGAQKSLALALRQNPNQQDAIDYRMHINSDDDVFLAAACRRELRRRPQVYLRVLLADTDYNLAFQKPVYRQEGLTQMEMAHAAAPHDYAVSLGLATFLLASGQTARAELLLKQIAPQALKQPKQQQAEYDVTRGIGAALAGNGKEARRFLTLAQKGDPKNGAAESALALLPD